MADAYLNFRRAAGSIFSQPPVLLRWAFACPSLVTLTVPVSLHLTVQTMQCLVELTHTTHGWT
jgi:hypothetical protein